MERMVALMTRPARTSVGYFGSVFGDRGCVCCVAMAGAVLLSACAAGDGRAGEGLSGVAVADVGGARLERAIEAQMLRAIEGSDARGAMTRAQRDRLAEVSAGLLAAWLEETPGAYRAYMVGLGGTPRTNDAEAELCERWMRESADLPWAEVRADEAEFRLPTIIDVEGRRAIVRRGSNEKTSWTGHGADVSLREGIEMVDVEGNQRAVVIQGSKGKALWLQRGAYALPWEGVELPPIDERLQVELHVPAVAPSGRVLELTLTFVWVEEGGIGWSPVRMWAMGENIAGAPASLPF